MAYLCTRLEIINVWNDADYLPRNVDPKIEPTQMFLRRQCHFISPCLETLQKGNRTWTLVINTDAYIVRNTLSKRKINGNAQKVYQYAGTFEQFSFRDDGRGSRTRKKYKGRRFDDWNDDSATFWLKDFVKEVGSKLASELLEGGRWLDGTTSL